MFSSEFRDDVAPHKVVMLECVGGLWRGMVDMLTVEIVEH